MNPYYLLSCVIRSRALCNPAPLPLYASKWYGREYDDDTTLPAIAAWPIPETVIAKA